MIFLSILQIEDDRSLGSIIISLKIILNVVDKFKAQTRLCAMCGLEYKVEIIGKLCWYNKSMINNFA